MMEEIKWHNYYWMVNCWKIPEVIETERNIWTIKTRLQNIIPLVPWSQLNIRNAITHLRPMFSSYTSPKNIALTFSGNSFHEKCPSTEVFVVRIFSYSDLLQCCKLCRKSPVLYFVWKVAIWFAVQIKRLNFYMKIIFDMSWWVWERLFKRILRMLLESLWQAQSLRLLAHVDKHSADFE